MARPLPVVAVPAELAYRRGGRKDQAHVVVIPIDGQPELIAAVVGIHSPYRGGVLRHHLAADDPHHGVDGHRAVGLVHTGTDNGQDALRHVLLPHQKADKQLRTRQFLCVRMRHETIAQVVVLHRAALADAAESAMVVGEHQSVPADHHARTKAAEADHGILQRGMSGIVKLLGGQFQSQFLHRTAGLLIQVAQHPHAFIGMGKASQKQAQRPNQIFQFHGHDRFLILL